MSNDITNLQFLLKFKAAVLELEICLPYSSSVENKNKKSDKLSTG